MWNSFHSCKGDADTHHRIPSRCEGSAGLGEPRSGLELTSLHTDPTSNPSCCAIARFAMEIGVSKHKPMEALAFQSDTWNSPKKTQLQPAQTPSIVLPETALNPTFYYLWFPNNFTGYPKYLSHSEKGTRKHNKGGIWKRRQDRKKVTQMNIWQRKIS